jgi:hypothetical protein
MNRIERGPHVHRGLHAAAARAGRQMAERTIADERLIVGREKPVEQRRALARRLLDQHVRRADDAGSAGDDQTQRQDEPFHHRLAILAATRGKGR